MPPTAIKPPATLEKLVASQVHEGGYRSRNAAIVAVMAHQKLPTKQRAWLESADAIHVEALIQLSRRSWQRHAIEMLDTVLPQTA